VDNLSVGVVASSRKTDERRLAIHPAHLERLPEQLRGNVVLERGYGEAFGYADTALQPYVGGFLPREELLAATDVVLLPKPLAQDLATLRPGQVVWGWPHCVQDTALTQLAIDRGLTLIA
jgi:alanine dehydrogenase